MPKSRSITVIWCKKRWIGEELKREDGKESKQRGRKGGRM